MTRRPGLSSEDVAKAAERLRHEGRQVSTVAVRVKLGGKGSWAPLDVKFTPADIKIIFAPLAFHSEIRQKRAIRGKCSALRQSTPFDVFKKPRRTRTTTNLQAGR